MLVADNAEEAVVVAVRLEKGLGLCVLVDLEDVTIGII